MGNSVGWKVGNSVGWKVGNSVGYSVGLRVTIRLRPAGLRVGINANGSHGGKAAQRSMTSLAEALSHMVPPRPSEKYCWPISVAVPRSFGPRTGTGSHPS